MEKFSIRDMVCNRYTMVVRQQFKKAGLEPIAVNMGEVELVSAPTESQLKLMSSSLQNFGLALIIYLLSSKE